jgi:hypothetical protein
MTDSLKCDDVIYIYIYNLYMSFELYNKKGYFIKKKLEHSAAFILFLNK